MDEQTAFIVEIARRLDHAGFTYMLTGSLALAVYGVPRMTRDIDLVVALDAGGVDRLCRLFSDTCYLDRDAVREAVASRGIFNAIHEAWLIKADFIVRKDDRYHVEELRRRRRVTLGDTSVAVVSPEDLVLAKLAWGRDSGSELQRRDVEAIIAAVDDLDWGYLRRWARALGLETALRELGAR